MLQFLIWGLTVAAAAMMSEGAKPPHILFVLSDE